MSDSDPIDNVTDLGEVIVLGGIVYVGYQAVKAFESSGKEENDVAPDTPASEISGTVSDFRPGSTRRYLTPEQTGASPTLEAGRGFSEFFERGGAGWKAILTGKTTDPRTGDEIRLWGPNPEGGGKILPWF